MKKCLVGLVVLSLVLSVFVGFGSISFAQEKYNEAPMLAELVKAGKLPPVEKRLPEEPRVVKPVEKVGQYGGTLRALMLSANSWCPISQYNYETLFLLDNPNSYKIVPGLAKGYSFTQGNKVLTVYLRKGLRWSDGEPFTADDIVWWFEDVLFNKDIYPVPPSQWTLYGKPVIVKKVNPYVVQFQFAGSYPSAIIYLSQVDSYGGQGQVFGPKHYLKQFHIKYNPDADKLAKAAKFDHWWQLFNNKAQRSRDYQPAGVPCLDPWVPVTVTTTGVRWERNPYYYSVDTAGNQLPYIDYLEGIIASDPETYTMRVMSGDVDFDSFSFPLENYPALKANEEKGGYRTWLGMIDWGSMAIWLNQNYNKDPILRDLFRDVRFRRALSLAIDRDEINKVVYLGMATPRQQTVVPSCSFYKKSWATSYAQFDLAKANQLLDEIGLTKRDADGYRLRPDGKTLTLVGIICPGVPGLDRLYQLLIGYWKQIGIKVESKPMGREFYWQYSWSTGEHQFAIRCCDQQTEQAFYAANWFLSIFGGAEWAPLWRIWLLTGGKNGEEPPKEVKDLWNLQQKLLTTTGLERTKIAQQLGDFQAQNLYAIGTVGLIPTPVMAKKGLRNIPEKAMGGGNLADPGGGRPYMVEQFFWEK